MEHWELEERRARNMIWNAAGTYAFHPDPLAINDQGEPDLYLNCILGALHKHYDWAQLSDLLTSVDDGMDSGTRKSLVWIGLENCAFGRERTERPVLEELRQNYARHILAKNRDTRDLPLAAAVEYGHCQRILGQAPLLTQRENTLLDALELDVTLDTAELVTQINVILETYFAQRLSKPAEAAQTSREWFLPALFSARQFTVPRLLSRLRRLGIGIADGHGGAPEPGDGKRHWHSPWRRADPERIRSQIENDYGRSAYSQEQRHDLERLLCTGNHSQCRLHFTRGEYGAVPTAKQEAALAQRKKNEAYYQQHQANFENSIVRLADRVRNALLAFREPEELFSTTGTLLGSRVWRAAMLNDQRVFGKTVWENKGDLSVDLLLDASSSQLHQQESVSAQGYMIAEALSRCGVPVRVFSFCSVTGYTIIQLFREYEERENNRCIFRYSSAGWNRDGLGIRAAAQLMNTSPCTHKLLLLLSDVNPNDEMRFPTEGSFLPGRDYSGKGAVEDTAAEVRRAQRAGVSVLCVFTGKNEDVDHAKTIYGKDFARIQSMDQFADTVGILLQNRIRML